MEASSRKKVGLALGAGAARGCAHFGVLDALREARIPIDYVAGTSIGSLVGGVLAAGKVDDLRHALLSMDLKEIVYHFFEVSFPRSGLIDGKRITEFIGQFVEDRCIEELDLPYRAVATDVITGEEVVLDSGTMMEAIRASVAMPGVFTPVLKGDRVLVDGGLVNPVPADVVRAMGADIVIAVDINHDRVGSRKRVTMADVEADVRPAHSSSEWQHRLREAFRVNRSMDMAVKAQVKKWTTSNKVPNIFDVLGNTIRIMEAQIGETMLQVAKPDVIIRPDVGYIGFMEFNKAEEAIAAGNLATREALHRAEIDWPAS